MSRRKQSDVGTDLGTDGPFFCCRLSKQVNAIGINPEFTFESIDDIEICL